MALIVVALESWRFRRGLARGERARGFGLEEQLQMSQENDGKPGVKEAAQRKRCRIQSTSASLSVAFPPSLALLPRPSARVVSALVCGGRSMSDWPK